MDGEAYRLLGGKAAAFLRGRAAHVVDLVARVLKDNVLLDRLLQHLPKLGVKLVEAARGSLLLAKLGVRLVDVSGRQVGDRQAAEQTLDPLGLDLVTADRQRRQGSGLLELAGVLADGQTGVLVVELLFELPPVLLQGDARLTLGASDSARGGPTSLAARLRRRDAMADAVNAAALDLDDASFARDLDSPFAHARHLFRSRFSRWSHSTILGGPKQQKVVPKWSRPSTDTKSNQTLLACELGFYSLYCIVSN